MVKRLIKKIRMEMTHHSLISEGVPEHEQVLKSNKPFWVFFGCNLGISTWLIGVLIAGMGLDFANAMFVLVLGSLLGALLPGLTATIGPQSRLSQMELGRFSLGKIGKKVPAFLNWTNAIGWDVINNILSTAALVALFAMAGINVPFWLVLVVLVAFQLVIGIYGHHLIQEMSPYSSAILAFIFVIIGIIAMRNVGSASVAEKPVHFSDIFAALSLVTIYNYAGWTTYTADYTRYLPKKTPILTVFLAVFISIALSTAILGFFGYMTAQAVTDQTPEGVMKALQTLTGHFAPLVLFLIGFSSIPINAINDNSAAYSLISSGFKFSRPTAAIFGAVIGYFVCLAASSSFVEYFENFLFLFGHWIGPWAAVILVHWAMRGRHEIKTPANVTIGAGILFIVSAVSIALFSATTLYTSPVAKALDGNDIGPYLGFVVAGVLYWLVLQFGGKKIV